MKDKYIAVDWTISPIGTTHQIGGCIHGHKMHLLIKYNLPRIEFIKTRKIENLTWFYIPTKYCGQTIKT